MFSWIQCIQYKNLGDHTYRLADTEFTIDIVIPNPTFMGVRGVETGSKVAIEYETRSLNISANLALYHKYMQWRWNYNFDWVVKENFKWYPELAKEFYGKYLDDIKRYMLLI